MKVTLPYPPSANRYWRTFRGHTVLSAEAKAYKKQVAAILSAAGWQPASGDVAYTAHVYRPLKSGDLDNRLKVLGDALTGYAWVDDKQVVELHAYRHDDKANPRVEVAIHTFGEQAPKDTGATLHPCAKCQKEAVAGTHFCPAHRPKPSLKRPAKVKSAYRAAKEAQEVLPKKRGEEFTPIAGLPMAPEWLQKAIHRHVVEETRPSRGVEGELQPIKVKDTPHHWWENTDTTGIRECIHCHIRATLTYGAWQRKKGGHWRGSAHDLIPDCTGPIQNLPHAQNGA